MADSGRLNNMLNQAANYETKYFDSVAHLLNKIKDDFAGSEQFRLLPAKGSHCFGFFVKTELKPLIIKWGTCDETFKIDPFTSINCCGLAFCFLDKKKDIVYMSPDHWVLIENGESSKAPDVMEILESLIPQPPGKSFTIL